MRFGSLAALFLLSAATAASATVYKVVGPDGKVSYTDQPLKASAENVHVFKAGTARPTNAVLNRQTAPGAAAPGKTQDGLGDVGGPGTVGIPGARGPEPTLLRPENAPLMPAVRKVLGQSTMVRESMQLCMQAQPASTRRFETTMNGWKTRNQEALDAAEEVLTTSLAPVPRIQLKQFILDHTRQTLRPLREGPSSQRINWCDVKTAEFGRNRLDPAEDAGLAQLLRAHRH